jgi:hypothetical protein
MMVGWSETDAVLSSVGDEERLVGRSPHFDAAASCKAFAWAGPRGTRGVGPPFEGGLDCTTSGVLFGEAGTEPKSSPEHPAETAANIKRAWVAWRS